MRQRGIAYLPIGNPAANYWGGDRPGDNLFGNSIVAVDALTGKYLWHFQTVHHDLWDTDMPNGGLLFNAKHQRQDEPVIAQVNKTGLFYELDRVTGKPALPVDERPVPQGRRARRMVQPDAAVPARHAAARAAMSFDYDDIVTAEDTTPEHAAACRAMWDKAGGYLNFGPFTPFMFHRDGAPPRSTIQLPGGTGGVNWGGMAVNPNTGVVYSNMSNTSLVGWVERKNTTKSYSFDATDTNQPYDRASVDGKGPFFSFSAPISGKYDDKGRPVGPQAPCYKPPWNTLTAVDANTGKVKWQVPLGLNEALPEGKQLVGNAGNAGPTVTAGGLVFVGATNDKRFRAFDADTGKQLWEARLSANANANPISYRGRERQAVCRDQRGRHDCRLCGSLIGKRSGSERGNFGMGKYGRLAMGAVLLAGAGAMVQPVAARGPARAAAGHAVPNPATIGGHPNLNGIWQAIDGADNGLEPHSAETSPGRQSPSVSLAPSRRFRRASASSTAA